MGEPLQKNDRLKELNKRLFTLQAECNVVLFEILAIENEGIDVCIAGLLHERDLVLASDPVDLDAL